MEANPPPGDGLSALNKRGNLISEEIQRQARKAASPVVNDFLIAARRGFTAQVLLALKEGGAAKANSVDKHGRNCLQIAAIHGHFDMVSSILQTSLIDINSVNKRGLTALHDACNEGRMKIALLLLAMGASVAAQTKDGWTCLMSACCNGHTQLTKLLLAIGCDVDAQTKLGLTALHIASWKGHVALVEILLHEGCNLQITAQNGKTALQLAQEEGQHQCVTVLTSAISKVSEEPRYKISSLEGQLRLHQKKLSETHRSYDKEITRQKLQSKEKLVLLQVNHEAEMEKMKKKIEDLELLLEKTAALSSSITASSSAKVSSKEGKDFTPVPPPPLQAKSPGDRRKKNTKKDASSSASHSKSGLIEALTSPPSHHSTLRADSDQLEPSDKPKSASCRDLSSDIKDDYIASELPQAQQLSPANSRRNSGKTFGNDGSSCRLTITALVEESLCNPGSMSAIRKELKADAFTPKIQRKFLKRPSVTSATLSSIAPVTDGAPENSSKGRGESLLPKGMQFKEE